MPTLVITCPHCRQNLNADAAFAGRTVSCPHCRGLFQVPPGPGAASLPTFGGPNSLPVITNQTSHPQASTKRKKSNVLLGVMLVGGCFSFLLVVLWASGLLQDVVGTYTGFGRVTVTGELFFSTKGGDVKIGAGQKVYLRKLSSKTRRDLVTTMNKVNALEAEHKKIRAIAQKKHPYPNFNDPDPEVNQKEFDKYYQVLVRDFPRLKTVTAEQQKLEKEAHAILVSECQEVRADSGGEFKVAVPAGTYILWTDVRAYGDEKFFWCTLFEATGTENKLLLSEDNLVEYDASNIIEPHLFKRILQNVALLLETAEGTK